MIYQYRCRYHGVFEIKQGIMEKHKADCPACGLTMDRVYLPVIHFWPDVLWHKDGSKQSPDELPPVPQDRNWGWHGVGESKLHNEKKDPAGN